MKKKLTVFLFWGALMNAQNTPCTTNLGGDADPGFITVRINNTTFNHNTFSAQTSFYHEYPASGQTTATLTAGQSYSLYTSTSSEAVIGLWMDYNNNGTFESSEFTPLVNSMTTQNTTALNIPANLPSGALKIRFRTRAYGSSVNGNNACSSFGSGETRDYTLTIVNNALSTQDIRKESALRYYPNPVNDILHVEDRLVIQNISVFDLSGKLLISLQPGQKKTVLDLSAFPAGTYMIKTETASETRDFKIQKN
ncbi:GEVED domain-containing protein [uncultured Chryseobacterium sp.]|uniref:GEVED domain-containing protein n=1 Tax=uncultured Chryseobacterium sp. TaxID=259322 RepID=UPI0025D32610|nr:GEVED domain-containing protein [uncultured Chryseobacterium sp.]